MKILIIIGSPRKKGNTFLVSEIIAQKLKTFNVEVEYLFLSDVNLGLCKGCCNCLIKGEAICPNKDDREEIEGKILSADGVIFASPVYSMNMPAIMKNFLDRFAFTMHRPRFFNQYTMIVAVTGSVGLNETISSISQLKYSGFNIVNKLGLVAQNPLVNPEISDEKMIKKIEKETEKFYKTVLANKPINPAFETIIQFHMQRKTFAKQQDKAPCDFEYFKSRGWFDKNHYYVEDAKISLGKKLLANLIAKSL